MKQDLVVVLYKNSNGQFQPFLFSTQITYQNGKSFLRRYFAYNNSNGWCGEMSEQEYNRAITQKVTEGIPTRTFRDSISLKDVVRKGENTT